jgi:peptidoglycan/LPS O-acetylase OafA/YrhL
MVDILVILFLVLILISLRKEKNSDSYLSKEKCASLRGIMAISIILHHLSERFSEYPVLNQFERVGYLIVAIFFFLSGYGLMCSYKIKGKEYFKGFWKTRIGYLFIVYFLISVVYFVYFNAVGEHISFSDFLLSFINGVPTAVFSWYIIVQLLFYIIFYSVFFFFDKTKNYIKIIIVFILTICMMVAFYMLKFAFYWYISDLAFVGGLLYSEYKKKIDLLLKKHYIIMLSATLVGCAISILLPVLASKINFQSTLLYPLSRNMFSMLLAVFLVFIMYKIDFKSKVLSYIGSISLEIYLIHGLFMNAFNRFNTSDLLYCVLVLICSIAFAILFSKINNLISVGLRKAIKK